MVRINTTPELDYQDVLILPNRGEIRSRNDVCLERTFEFKYSKRRWSGIPIIASNMVNVGTFEMVEKLAPHKMIVTLEKHYPIERFIDFYNTNDSSVTDYAWMSVGYSGDALDTLRRVKGETTNLNFVSVDVPNGYIEDFADHIRRIREEFPELTISAGNVCEKNMTEVLITNGHADIVKCGIGPGAQCTTRLNTGVGRPQLSTVLDCANGAHGLGGRIIADGGITSVGDMAKAFAADADFIMVGSMFAGYLGDIETDTHGKQFITFYGSSSRLANMRNHGEMRSYRAPEGRVTHVPYKGDIEVFLQTIKGGLRSTGSYIGAKTIREFSRCATLQVVNRQLNTSYVQHDQTPKTDG